MFFSYKGIENIMEMTQKIFSKALPQKANSSMTDREKWILSTNP